MSIELLESLIEHPGWKLFQAHVRECERIHAEARESRREILAWLERLDEKIDELRGRP